MIEKIQGPRKELLSSNLHIIQGLHLTFGHGWALDNSEKNPSYSKGNTAKKINIERENHHFEKEIHLPNPHFGVPR